MQENAHLSVVFGSTQPCIGQRLPRRHVCCLLGARLEVFLPAAAVRRALEAAGVEFIGRTAVARACDFESR